MKNTVKKVLLTGLLLAGCAGVKTEAQITKTMKGFGLVFCGLTGACFSAGLGAMLLRNTNGNLVALSGALLGCGGSGASLVVLWKGLKMMHLGIKT